MPQRRGTNGRRIRAERPFVVGKCTDLVVRQMHVLHRQHGQFVRPVGVSAVFHVPGNGEQLGGRHDVRRGVQNDLIGRFERGRVVLAQRQRVQSAIRRVLRTQVRMKILYNKRV